jgi:pyruvate/2-oxoglutarate dehydrogenase complex dihydrolipoamide acyltransferase (E2) component
MQPQDPNYPSAPTPPPPDYPWSWAPPPPTPARKTHRLRNWGIGVAALVVVGAIVGPFAFGGSSNKAAKSTAPSTTAAAPSSEAAAADTSSAPESSAPAVPNPDGKVSATCDYQLRDDLNNYDTHAGDLNAEVEVENTGNVGIVVKVTLKWHQLGHPAIVQTKTVRVAYGKTQTLELTRPVTSSEIDRLQSWESGNMGGSDCDVDGTTVDTFGPVH